MAALTKPAVGNGTTVSGLGQTTFITSITAPEEAIDVIETTDLSTTDFKTVMKNPLINTVKVSVEGFWTGAAITNGATGTFTITWPNAGSYAGTGIVTNVKYPEAKIGEAMKCSYDVTFDGYTGPALTPA